MITRNALWINNRRYVPPASEFIEIKMKADANWKVYVPTAWANGLSRRWSTLANDTYGAVYNWDVYLDNNFSVNISGQSTRQWYREVGSNLQPDSFHYIKIYPHVVDPISWLPWYWRAMAFAMGWGCVASQDLSGKNPIAEYLYEILYDGAILWYRYSATEIGSWYKSCQYAWCINLTKAYEETDISDVTAIGSQFLAWQYAETWITESVTERSPGPCNAYIWYREQQYWKCQNLITAADEVDPTELILTNSYREGQYGYCTSLRVTAPERPPVQFNGGAEYRLNQYIGCSWLKTISRIEYCSGYPASQFRENQFVNCWDFNDPITAYIYGSDVVKWVTNSLWLSNDKIYRIFVPSNLVSAYQNDNQWSNIDDNKFVWM